MDKIDLKEKELNQLKIDLISRFYPLSNEDLIKYKEILNFGRYQLIINENINWNIDLIKSVKEKLDCTAFWKLKNISLNRLFFDAFDDLIDYSSIHLSKNIEWSSDLISIYGDKFEWNKLSMRKDPLSNIDYLRQFRNRVDWQSVSERINLNFSDEIIEEFKDFWNWSKLSLNENLPISLEFLEKYKDKLDFGELSRNPACIDIILKYHKSSRWNWNNVIVNPGLKYNDEIFELVFFYFKNQSIYKFWNKTTFYNITINSILKRVFHSPFTQKSYFLKERFTALLPWDVVSKSNVVLDMDFIINFKDKIDFKENGFLKENGKLIDKDFILCNIELFNLENYRFYYLDIDNEILEKCKENINWNYLSSSENFEWSWKFVSDNYDKLNFFRLSINEGVYRDLTKNILSDEEIYSFLDNNKNIKN